MPSRTHSFLLSLSIPIFFFLHRSESSSLSFFFFFYFMLFAFCAQSVVTRQLSLSKFFPDRLAIMLNFFSPTVAFFFGAARSPFLTC